MNCIFLKNLNKINASRVSQEVNSFKHVWEKCMIVFFPWNDILLQQHEHFQLLQGSSLSFLVLDSNLLYRVGEYSTADRNINLGHLAFSPTGTTESLWASPTVSTRTCPERDTSCVCF